MANNPYKVLGVKPGASKKEIKDAYNQLVKKYHPDKYKEEHMKELAEQKMKEINEAYDMLINGNYADRNTEGTYSSNNGNSGNTGDYEFYQQIRRLIQAGRFSEAQNLLNESKVRDAEWYYLMGVIHIQYGNYYEGRALFEKAMRLNPENSEYRAAYQQTLNGTFFSRRAGHARTDSDQCCRICATLYCLDCCCEMGGGDFISCC
jgi:curved DNA-binding protein CbpA